PPMASTTGGGTPLLSGGLLRAQILAPLQLHVPGDYAGLTADRDGTFHPYWIDNRTGWHQVWTAAVNVAAKAVKNGAQDLASLDDLTPMTTLERQSSGYDRAAQTTTMTVRLKNTSTQTLM